MSVIFFPKYHREGASSRYRTFNYLEYFEKNGLYYEVFPLFYNGYVSDLYNSHKSIFKIVISYIKRLFRLLSLKNKGNFFVIEKELFPGLPYFFEKIFLKKGFYSIDYDDAIFLKYAGIFFLRNKHIYLCQSAKFVTCGNKWYFKQLPGANCKYFPTVVNVLPNTAPKIPTTKKTIICWIGTPSNIDYLKSILPVLRSLKNKGFNFKLRVIGCQLLDNQIEIENLKWKEENEFEYLASSDIGIMPLFDSEWENGKCGFKLLQYMAARLPVVGSPSAANSVIIKHNVNGFLANNHSDWEKYLVKLCSDEKLRINFGDAGFNIVLSDYSYAKWEVLYYDLLKEQK